MQNRAVSQSGVAGFHLPPSGQSLQGTTVHFTHCFKTFADNYLYVGSGFFPANDPHVKQDKPRISGRIFPGPNLARAISKQYFSFRTVTLPKSPPALGPIVHSDEPAKLGIAISPM